MAKKPTHDVRKRRLRNERSPTGKRIAPQPRDLLWFEKIRRHGPLSSTYLHAFSEHLCKNAQRARNRLTDLYNEKNNPHGSFYLDRPWQQFQTFDARYQDLVYDITEAAEAALVEAGRFNTDAAPPSGPWVHRYMVAAVTASLEVETLADPGLGYIPQEAILDRAGTGLRTPVSFTDPRSGRRETRDLLPDALCGIEYRRPDGRKAYRFFIIEVDRGTEPLRSGSLQRKSLRRSLLQYRSYIGEGLYKTHLGLTASLMLLTVTSNETHLGNMVSLVEELSGGRGNAYLLFKAAPQIGGAFKPTPIMGDLLISPWQRAGHAPFSINRL